MKKLTLLLIAVAVSVCFACKRTDTDTSKVITVDLSDEATYSPIESAVSQMDIIPLVCPDDVILADDNLVNLCGDKIVVTDKLHANKIHIFNADGSHRATIAAMGRGPQEYVNINNIQIVDDKTIAIFSYHKNAVLYYDTDAKFIRRDDLKASFAPSYIHVADGNYMYYMGFGNAEMSDRLVRVDPEGKITGRYMHSDAAILPMMETDPVIVEYGDRLLVREAMSDRITEIDGDNERTFMEFDFGRQGIPDSYYQYDNPMDAAMFLMKSDFITVNQLFADKDLIVVGTRLNRSMDHTGTTQIAPIGIMRNDRPQWIEARSDNASALLCNTVRGLYDDSTLMLLADAQRIRDFSQAYPRLLPTEKLDKISNAEYSLVLCRLKK